MAASPMRRVIAQVWGPDPLTVDAVAAIDAMWGLTLAGRGNDWELRNGITGHGVGQGDSFSGELGPLQAFEFLGGGVGANRVDLTGGLPASTGPGEGPSTIQAMLAGSL
jgi:hypothetical protein